MRDDQDSNSNNKVSERFLSPNSTKSLRSQVQGKLDVLEDFSLRRKILLTQLKYHLISTTNMEGQLNTRESQIRVLQGIGTWWITSWRQCQRSWRSLMRVQARRFKLLEGEIIRDLNWNSKLQISQWCLLRKTMRSHAGHSPPPTLRSRWNCRNKILHQLCHNIQEGKPIKSLSKLIYRRLLKNL